PNRRQELRAARVEAEMQRDSELAATHPASDREELEHRIEPAAETDYAFRATTAVLETLVERGRVDLTAGGAPKEQRPSTGEPATRVIRDRGPDRGDPDRGADELRRTARDGDREEMFHNRDEEDDREPGGGRAEPLDRPDPGTNRPGPEELGPGGTDP